ncbi:MAG: hypothetical protein WBB28_02025 [Crinalium sp.]
MAQETPDAPAREDIKNKMRGLLAIASEYAQSTWDTPVGSYQDRIREEVSAIASMIAAHAKSQDILLDEDTVRDAV